MNIDKQWLENSGACTDGRVSGISGRVSGMVSGISGKVSGMEKDFKIWTRISKRRYSQWNLLDIRVLGVLVCLNAHRMRIRNVFALCSVYSAILKGIEQCLRTEIPTVSLPQLSTDTRAIVAFHRHTCLGTA